jgi:imidazolonepropionase-like amidohydrolase
MLSIAVLLLANALGTHRASNSSATLKFTVLKNGVRGGQEVDTFGRGRIDVAFEYNDRGRGPKVRGRYLLDAHGIPIKIDLVGVDYFKAPVNEHFWISGGKANWKSTSEKGTSDHGGFYISNNGASAEFGQLASVLLHRKGAIRLYPGGQASVSKANEVTLTAGGKKEHVTEYLVSGLSFTPVPVWLDDDDRFFAQPSDWQATIRTGWEQFNKRLFDIETRTDETRYTKLASQLSVMPSRPVAFQHVRLFDSENARMIEDQTVVVKGSKIEEVGPSSSVQIPAGAQTIDGTGKALLPGLFDMHTHTGDPDGLLNIASGVTSVRDMGNSIDTLAKLQKFWDSGEQIGPRLFKAGLIDGRGPYQCPTGLYASTLNEALADANRYIDLGYIQIKIYSSLNPAFVPELVKLAHKRGVRVSGHVPQGLFAKEFVEDGADEVQHMNFIMLNFLRDKVKDSRTPERFTAVARYGSGIDQDSKEFHDFVDFLLAHHTTIDATVATFEPMFCARPGACEPDYVPILHRLPAQVQRGAFAGGLPTTAATDKVYKDSYAAMLRMLGKLYDAGVPILAGTDYIAGFTLHRELELEVKAGIPAPKALQIATWNAAKLLKQEKTLGSIAPGKTADLLLVAGDPGTNISDIRRGRIVMKNGVLFNCDSVYAAIGVLPSN